MQNILLGIACTNTPAQAKIVLIDPKLGVDYFAFEGMPHLQDGIIDDQDKAIQKLEELVGEMNRRYTVLKANKVANIFDLNKKADATERLPFLWIIHDEFAEWMMTESYADAVSDVVSRLGVKARAAGISLVFAAQRPDANVMPMQLRANLGNRLVLRVDGEGTSEIALGEKGAERFSARDTCSRSSRAKARLLWLRCRLLMRPSWEAWCKLSLDRLLFRWRTTIGFSESRVGSGREACGGRLILAATALPAAFQPSVAIVRDIPAVACGFHR